MGLKTFFFKNHPLCGNRAEGMVAQRVIFKNGQYVLIYNRSYPADVDATFSKIKWRHKAD
jgi:hypothetical protein